jgi:hypothetical protein
VKYRKPSCQHLSGHRIDEAVTQAFFGVLHAAQIDALEKVARRQADHHRERCDHLRQELARYEYQARRAERQYDCVDPENRLTAATLEKKWEEALTDLEQAKTNLADALAEPPETVVIPPAVRDAFTGVGKNLPALWPRLSREAQKALLRTLVDGVNLLRQADGMVQVRIVWRGGLVSEENVRLPVHSLQYSPAERTVADRIRRLSEEGLDNDRIVRRLNEEGFVPCRGGAFTTRIVIKLKQRYRIVSNLGKARGGNLTNAYTLREMARQIGVHPSWIYREIGRRTVKIKKDPRYGCYLFPRTEQAVTQMNRLKQGELRHVSFPKVHCTG